MHFEDLQPCTYFKYEGAVALTAVGWLEDGHPFPTGQCPSDIVDRLWELAEKAWQPGVFRGWHDCDWCPPRAIQALPTFAHPRTGKSILLGCFNIFVPTRETVYVAPALILHYIKSHGYLPPAKFCAAVTACPTIRSGEYRRAMAALLPKALANEEP